MTKKQQERKIEDAIAAMFYRVANCVPISVMDIPKLYRECREGWIVQGRDLETVMQECVAKYRRN